MVWIIRVLYNLIQNEQTTSSECYVLPKIVFPTLLFGLPGASTVWRILVPRMWKSFFECNFPEQRFPEKRWNDSSRLSKVLRLEVISAGSKVQCSFEYSDTFGAWLKTCNLQAPRIHK